MHVVSSIIRYYCDTMLDVRDRLLDVWDWVIGREIEVRQPPPMLKPGDRNRF